MLHDFMQECISNHVNSLTKDDPKLLDYDPVSVGAYRFLVGRTGR
jgi:hypothetical protein